MTDVWLTPPHVIDALGGLKSFDLDPCAPIIRPWPTAKRHYTVTDIEGAGLAREWFGRVWLNPPYGAPSIIGPWLDKMVAHNRGTALIFARTETEVFFRCVWEKATAVLFLKGRLRFHNEDGTRAKGNAGAPSVLVAYGTHDSQLLYRCNLAGRFLCLK